MRYFVVAEDGGKYGPAEVPLLNQWIEEGRLLPDMTLEEDGSHHRVYAASVLGLDFDEKGDAVVAPASPAPRVAMAQETTTVPSTNPDLILSCVMVALTLATAPVTLVIGYLGIFTTILGCMAALKAKERSNALAGPLLVANMVAFVVWLSMHLVFGLRSA